MNYFSSNPYLRPSAIAFLITFLFLLYLSLIAQPIIANDSVEYMDLARRIDLQGISSYLLPGPQREPLYPLMIAMAMKMGRGLNCDYLFIVKWVQVLFLMATQVLAYVILKRLNVRRWLTAAVVLSIGITPALVNSAFWIYSEILTYPFILLMIYAASRIWQKQGRGDAFLFGMCCTALTLTKAVFELIVPVFLMAFIVYAITNRAIFQKMVVCVLIAAAAYYIPITGYKWLNYKTHGSFVLTNRGPWALYGYTARRLQPLNPERLMAMLAYIPGPEFCAKVIPESHCTWWSIYPADQMGLDRLHGLIAQGLKQKAIDQDLMAHSFSEIKQHPFQYVALTYAESFKSLFWFNDYDSQVAYPTWVDWIYQHRILFMIKACAIALMTFAAYLWLGVWVMRRQEPHLWPLGLFMFVLMNIYIASYTLVQVTPRYALPLAPVFLIMMALCVDRLFRKPSSEKIIDNL